MKISKKYNGIINKKIENIQKSIKDFEFKLNDLINIDNNKQKLKQDIEKYKDIKKLDRKLVVSLVDKIYVYENLKICVKFRFDEKYREIINLLNNLKDLKVVI